MGLRFLSLGGCLEKGLKLLGNIVIGLSVSFLFLFLSCHLPLFCFACFVDEEKQLLE